VAFGDDSLDIERRIGMKFAEQETERVNIAGGGDGDSRATVRGSRIAAVIACMTVASLGSAPSD